MLCMLNRAHIIAVILFFVSLMNGMGKNEANQDMQLGAVEKKAVSVSSLKQSCFRNLVNQTPEKIEDLFKKTCIPSELMHEFACEIAKNASDDYVIRVAGSLLSPLSYPDMALKVVTERKRGDTDEKKKILQELLTILKQKEAVLEHKIVEGIKNIFDGSSNQSEWTLFADSFLDVEDICLFQFLLKRRNCKKNKIERLLNIPQSDEDSFEGKGKFTRWVDFFEKNVSKQIDSLQNEDWQELIELYGAKKTAYFFGLEDTYSSLLLKMHKLLYLGFRPSPEGFCFKKDKRYNIETRSFYNNCFIKKISCIDLIRYSLKKLYNKKFCDCNYASLRFRLDGAKYQEDNAQFAEQIINFYEGNLRKSKISYIDDAITDERYCKDRHFFARIINLKRKFYFSALRLLLPYCKEEFEKKEFMFAQLLTVPVGCIERFISYNTYNPASKEAQWDLYTIKNDKSKNNN